MLARADCQAGARPNRTAVADERSRRPQAAARPSGPRRGSREPSAEISRSSASRPSQANAIPIAPPSAASTKLSVSNCRMSRATHAERQAKIDLTPARRGARQQQIGDVGAGDQQHEDDRAHHQLQRTRKLRAKVGQPSAGRLEPHGRSRDIAPDVLRQLSVRRCRSATCRNVSVSAGASLTSPRPADAADHLKPACARILKQVSPGNDLSPHRQRNPEIRRDADVFAEKARWRHAD